jgi:hypothetical protein
MNEERCDLLCVDAPRAATIRGAFLDSVSAGEADERVRALSDPTRLVLAAVTLVTMPPLAIAKGRIGEKLGFSATKSEG